MTINNQVKGALCGCISAVSYGTNPIFAKYLYMDGCSASCVLFYRFFFGSLLLALLMVGQRRSFSVTRQECLVLGSLGLIFAVSSLTYFLSFYYMSAGVAATLVFAYPVFVALIMAVFFHERLKWPSVLAIFLTLGGILLLYKGDAAHPIAWEGIVFILISALTYALYIIVINRSGVVMSSIKLTFFAMFFCLLFLIIYSVAFPSTGEIQLLTGLWDWTMAVMLGLFPTVISLVFMAMAVKLIGSTSTAIMGALEPVTATLFGCLLFAEVITPRVGAGIVLILLSVILIILDPRLRRALSSIHVIRKGRIFSRHTQWK